MLLWDDRDDGTAYGYADKILIFSVQYQEGSALPWRLSSNLPGMPVLAGQEKHLARGDAKACAAKMVDSFLRLAGWTWKFQEAEARPSWAVSQLGVFREDRVASPQADRVAA